MALTNQKLQQLYRRAAGVHTAVTLQKQLLQQLPLHLEVLLLQLLLAAVDCFPRSQVSLDAVSKHLSLLVTMECKQLLHIAYWLQASVQRRSWT